MLLLALTVAVIVPNLTTKHIAGVAIVTPPPAAPVVGDCALESFNTESEMIQTPKGLQPIYSLQPTGPCQGTVYGQISAVIANPASTAELLDGGGLDPNYARCPGNATGEGLPPGSDDGTAHGHWLVQLATNTALIGPGPRQVSAGQHWVACIIAISQDQRTAGTQNADNQARGFTEPVSRWRHFPQIAEAVGQCLLTTSASFDSPNCSVTHAAESFGSTTGPLTPELTTTCRALAADLTGMPDPTAGGRLHVEVLSYDANGDQIATTSQRTRADTNQICTINGGGRSYLKGTILALGDHPVPFG